jgi:hypothetical protein
MHDWPVARVSGEYADLKGHRARALLDELGAALVIVSPPLRVEIGVMNSIQRAKDELERARGRADPDAEAQALQNLGEAYLVSRE